MSLERLSPAGAEMEHGQSQLFNDAEHFRNSMLRKYVLDGAYDEMFTAEGEARAHYRRLLDMFAHMPQEEIERCKKAADLSFLTRASPSRSTGEKQGTERIFPNDLLPRIITQHGMDAHRTRADAAHRRAEPVPARHLQRRSDSERRHGAARADLQLQAFPPRDARPAGAARRLYPVAAPT